MKIRTIVLSGLFLMSIHPSYAVTPEQVLPKGKIAIKVDGKKVRKGTILALLQNIFTLDRLLTEDHKVTEMETVLHDINQILPNLKAVRFFEVFPPLEWINATDKEGRVYQSKVMVGALYLQAYPHEVTPKIMKAVKAVLKQQICSDLQRQLERIPGV